jgi:hypothetical protein
VLAVAPLGGDRALRPPRANWPGEEDQQSKVELGKVINLPFVFDINLGVGGVALVPLSLLGLLRLLRLVLVLLLFVDADFLAGFPGLSALLFVDADLLAAVTGTSALFFVDADLFFDARTGLRTLDSGLGGVASFVTFPSDARSLIR